MFEVDNGPSKEKVKEAIASLTNTIAALRHPTKGCPWDLKQNHMTLRKYMLEEAYEAASEMNSPEGSDKLCEELGDVLLQVVLNAQVAKDHGKFDLVDVINSIDEKMIRRHPHVFDPSEKAKDEASIKRNWERIKEEEKREKKDKSYFSKAEKVHPASSRAHEIGKLASKINFDWQNVQQVIAKLESEVKELKDAIANQDAISDIESEMGDVFFSAAQVARHLGLDAEASAHMGNDKFLRRFEQVEDLAKESGLDVTSASQDQLEELWNKAKEKNP